MAIHATGLRVSQAEIARLADTGRVEDTLTFAPGQTLGLFAGETGAALAAAFDGRRISIVLPAAAAKRWMESDEAGIEGASGPVKVLVEKISGACTAATKPRTRSRTL